MMTVILLISGITLLYFGADWLVKGSANIALRAGISSLVVGLTIVAFGTSAPELVVSLKAGLDGIGNIAVGNVIGSNIFNIAVILGLSAVISPLKVNIQVLRVDIPIMIGFSILLWFLLLDNTIRRFEGTFLIVTIAIYTILTIYLGKKDAVQLPAASTNKTIQKEQAWEKSLLPNILLILIGLCALVFGSRFFVNGAIKLAQHFQISEAIIGLTIVAMGTSLPELATSIVAAVKREEDIAIGNIVGSNIFNIVAILGISGTLTPLTAPGIKVIDLAFMTGTAIILLPLMRTGFRLVRIEGLILLCVYVAYIWYLWPK